MLEMKTKKYCCRRNVYLWNVPVIIQQRAFDLAGTLGQDVVTKLNAINEKHQNQLTKMNYCCLRWIGLHYPKKKGWVSKTCM